MAIYEYINKSIFYYYYYLRNNTIRQNYVLPLLANFIRGVVREGIAFGRTKILTVDISTLDKKKKRKKKKTFFSFTLNYIYIYIKKKEKNFFSFTLNYIY